MNTRCYLTNLNPNDLPSSSTVFFSNFKSQYSSRLELDFPGLYNMPSVNNALKPHFYSSYKRSRVIKVKLSIVNLAILPFQVSTTIQAPSMDNGCSIPALINILLLPQLLQEWTNSTSAQWYFKNFSSNYYKKNSPPGVKKDILEILNDLKKDLRSKELIAKDFTNKSERIQSTIQNLKSSTLMMCLSSSYPIELIDKEDLDRVMRIKEQADLNISRLEDQISFAKSFLEHFKDYIKIEFITNENDHSKKTTTSHMSAVDFLEDLKNIKNTNEEQQKQRKPMLVASGHFNEAQKLYKQNALYSISPKELLINKFYVAMDAGKNTYLCKSSRNATADKFMINAKKFFSPKEFENNSNDYLNKKDTLAYELIEVRLADAQVVECNENLPNNEAKISPIKMRL